MSEVNIDVQLVVGGDVVLSCMEEKFVEMINGCICCIFCEDLFKEVVVLVQEG